MRVVRFRKADNPSTVCMPPICDLRPVRPVTGGLAALHEVGGDLALRRLLGRQIGKRGEDEVRSLVSCSTRRAQRVGPRRGPRARIAAGMGREAGARARWACASGRSESGLGRGGAGRGRARIGPARAREGDDFATLEGLREGHPSARSPPPETTGPVWRLGPVKPVPGSIPEVQK